MSDRNKAVVRRLVEEVYNRGEVRLLSELVAESHVGHEAIGDHYGPEGVQVCVLELRAAFPDLRVTLEDLVAEGDRVVRRFTFRGTHTGPFQGIQPTGQRVAAGGIAIDRLAGGKLVESWVSLDALGLLRQLDVSNRSIYSEDRDLAPHSDTRMVVDALTVDSGSDPADGPNEREHGQPGDGVGLERLTPALPHSRAAD